jgi:hypothetical protein
MSIRIEKSFKRKAEHNYLAASHSMNFLPGLVLAFIAPWIPV